MVSKGKPWSILIADNDIDFLETRAEYLEEEGYQVLSASSLEEARQLLAEARIHLAILDIRMVDDDDEKDTSGLTLAKDPTYRSVPKIILTDYPTYEAVREALGLAIDGLPPAVGFLDKKEGPDTMLQTVDQVLEKHSGLNWDLEIDMGRKQPLSFLYLVSLLQSGQPDDLKLQRAGELEDLFRRLFRDYRQIRIDRLLWSDEGRLCLPILARSPRGATDSRIVVCGRQDLLTQELDRVKELAPATVQGVRLAGSEHTMHFGAVIYDLPDANVETIAPLGDLVQRGKRRPLKLAFNHLLTKVLPAWHERGSDTEKVLGLMALYRRHVGLEEERMPRLEVERRVDAMVQISRSLGPVEIQRREGKLVFHFPAQPLLVCPDPVAAVYETLSSYKVRIIHKVSPGRLTARNVLVDEEQRTWLTDFRHSGQAPQWWDYVLLEVATRFNLSQAPNLPAWLEFEECLTAPSSLQERLREGDVIGDLQIAVFLTELIRRQASSETGPDPLPYYAGLLVWAVGAIAQYDPADLHTHSERMRGAHLLLAAAMIARRLDELTTPSSMGSFSQSAKNERGMAPALRLDNDGIQVRIGMDRTLDLTGQELELFRCLFEQAGKVVPRQRLIERAFGEAYAPTDPYQERRLNSLVRRLREKLELDTGRGDYITTVRGQGYRLNTEE